MKAVSYAQGKVNFNANAPTPKGDGVLVDIVSAGICGSDLHLLHSGAHSPHVAGHEIAGITPNGKHVAIEPIIPCWDCALCHKGDYHICKNNSEGLGALCDNIYEIFTFEVFDNIAEIPVWADKFM